MADDYYDLLQISRSATAEEIQKAYRKLARKYHPDLHADKSDQEKERLQAGLQVHQLTNDISRQMMELYGKVIPKITAETKK